MSRAHSAIDGVERNLHWRTRQFVDHATDGSTEAVNIVQQLTTDLGEYVVLGVRTTDAQYWVVSGPTGFVLYPRAEFPSASGALSDHLDAVHAG